MFERNSKEPEKIEPKTNVIKHIVTTCLIAFIGIFVQVFIIRGLSVFDTSIGTLLLLQYFLFVIALLGIFVACNWLLAEHASKIPERKIDDWDDKYEWNIVALVILVIITIALVVVNAINYGLLSLIPLVPATLAIVYYGRKRPWRIYTYNIILAVASTSPYTLGWGLNMDVPFTWVLNKAGLNLLDLRYLNGWTIWFVFILTALFLLSDPRISYEKGEDGKKHLYVHSKILGIIKYIEFYGKEKDPVGDNPDYPIIEKIEDQEEVSHSRYNDYKDLHWNDKVRLLSLPYAVWLFSKLLIGLVVASIMPDIAMRFQIIQINLNKTGLTWTDMLGKSIGISSSKIFGGTMATVTFPISEVFTFEFIQFINVFIRMFALIWGIRLFFAVMGEITVRSSGHGYQRPLMQAVSNAAALIAMIIFTVNIINIPMWVFNRATPYSVQQTIVVFGVFVVVALVFKVAAHYKPLSNLIISGIKWLRVGTLKRWVEVLTLTGVIVTALFSPTLIQMVNVNPYIEGRTIEYVWEPAYLPTISFTRFAYEIDTIERVDDSLITTNRTDVLKNVRIFDLAAAKKNMKQFVGAYNWMSIDPADVDIVYVNGEEYWVAILSLVHPEYTLAGDPDIWRSEHLLLTHSEKILAINSMSTEMIDGSIVFNLTETPQIYYGEGSLWKSADEVYLDIPRFSEAHISDYQGPLSYNDRPDYVYDGIWRAWKFYGMNRWDFALGDYGPIKTLVTRDVNDRLSKILLPGMSTESDAYPVTDGKGNLYLLYWVYVTRESPHGYCDYPENKDNKITRKFAIALVNLKNGEIDGYLFKERDDYLLTFYRTFYPNWDKPIPDWLRKQLRYPEGFLEKQISMYNWYFQDNFEDWQNNRFYDLTTDAAGAKPIEDVRYIVTPVNEEDKWSGERLVEWYQGNTRNLAGMYVAPCSYDTGKLYFVDFKDTTVIGPSYALQTVSTDTRLTDHPAFPTWKHGNIIMYSVAGEYWYIIPYYKEEPTVLWPQMVAVVDGLYIEGQNQTMGYHIIVNPRDPTEVSMAAIKALQNAGVSIGGEIEISGTIADIKEVNVQGNTWWRIDIQMANGTIVRVTAKAELLEDSIAMLDKILFAKIGDQLTVSVDQTYVVTKVLL